MSKFPVNQTLAIETKPLCQHNKIAQNIVTVFYQEKPIRLEEKTHLKKIGVDKRKVVYNSQCRNNSNCCWWASDLNKKNLEGDLFKRVSIFSIEEQDKDLRNHSGDGGFADYWGRANALSRHYKSITFMDKFRQGCKRSKNFFNKPKYAIDQQQQQQQGCQSVTWLMKPISKIRSSHADIRLKGIQNKLKNSLIKCKLKPTKSSRDPLPFRNIVTKSYNADEWINLHTPSQVPEQQVVELESNNATKCQKNEIIETSHQENNDWQQKIIELCQQDQTVAEEKPESRAANKIKREEIEGINSKESVATLVNQVEQNPPIKIEKEDSKDSSTTLEANTAIKGKDLKILNKLSKKTVNHSKRKKVKIIKSKNSPKVEKAESVSNVKQETENSSNNPNIVKTANKNLKQTNQNQNNNNKSTDKALKKPAKEEDLKKKNPNKLKNPERPSQTNVKNENLSKNKQNQVTDCDKVTLVTVKQKNMKSPKESLKKDKPVNTLHNLEKALHSGDGKPIETKPPAETTTASKSKKAENTAKEINLKCVPLDKATAIQPNTSPTMNLKLKYFKESTNKLTHKSSFEMKERNRKKRQLLLKYFKESDLEKPETPKQTAMPSILQQYPKHLLPVVQYNEERQNEKHSSYKTNIERKWNMESVKTPTIIEFFNIQDKNRIPCLCKDFEIQPGNKTAKTIVKKQKIPTKSEETTSTSTCYSKTLDKLTNLGKYQHLKLTKSKTGNTIHKIKPQSKQVLNTSKYIAQLMQTVVTKAYESEIKPKRQLRQPTNGNKLNKPNIVVKHQETPKASIT